MPTDEEEKQTSGWLKTNANNINTPQASANGYTAQMAKKDTAEWGQELSDADAEAFAALDANTRRQKLDLMKADYLRKQGENQEDQEATEKEEQTNTAYKEFDERAGINNTPPATPPATNNTPPATNSTQAAITETAEKVNNGESVQQAATETALDRFINNVSNGDAGTADKIRDMFKRFMEGKLPQGSKPFLIMNAIATAGQNIANLLATSEYNNRWSTIQSGQYKTPEFNTSLMQDLKAKGIQGQQDLMSEILAADAKEQLTGEGQRKAKKEEADIQGQETENEIKKIEKDLKKKYGDREYLANITGQELANDAANLDNMDKRTRLKYLDKMLQVDYDTQMAALRELKFGGLKGKIKIPGVGEIDATGPALINAIESGKATMEQVWQAVRGHFE